MASMSNMSGRVVVGGMLVLAMLGAPLQAAAQSARDLYTRALGRERAIRDAGHDPTAREIRSVIAAYEGVARRFPTSGYSDNALWQASNLSLLAFQRFGDAGDRRTGLRLLNQLKRSYPASSLLDRFDETAAAFEADPPTAASARNAISSKDITTRPKEPPARPTTARDSRPVAAVPASLAAPSEPDPAEEEPASSRTTTRAVGSTGEMVAIRAVTRTPLPDGIRVTIEMDGEITYRQERLENPKRVFFDLKNTRPVPNLLDATLKYPDEPVKEIRFGRHPQNTTRVVMDMDGLESYTVFALYNPYRMVIDFRKVGAPVVTAVIPRMPPSVVAPIMLPKPTTGVMTPPPPALPAVSQPAPIATSSASASIEKEREKEKAPLPSRPAIPPALAAPSVPSANSNGRFSIARQLGLGVSRIVIDAGHGGHDPGARGNGMNESELTLDVALRLRKLLEDQPGVEVVMTRETDVFIPLEERTAIANRESADLFLSIHANASRNLKSHGVETYFLNFASNPEAAAVAARENSASGKTMHSLPEIVRAITLNNKIDESRDFAEIVQKAMVKKLSVKNTELRDLGVKQAPFVVLIGAGMPSVLAEISFITHKQEGQLLKTSAYRQQIAEALFDAVQGYQKSLKARSAIASREE
jgi:N-acetylmuramoyl-L-alanine amidase